MKRICFVASIGLMSASLAFGQTSVNSANAVGYVRVDVPAKSLVLVTMPLDSMGNQTINEIFANDLVGNNFPAKADQILKWDAEQQKYVTFFKHGTGEWRLLQEMTATTETIVPGESFWVRSNQVTNQVLFLKGEVPGTNNYPTVTMPILPGLQLVGYPYPVAVAIQDLNLTGITRNTFPAKADQLLRWDVAEQSYVTYFAHTEGWRRLDTVTNTADVIQPGEGTWYRSRAAQEWQAVKPYQWP